MQFLWHAGLKPASVAPVKSLHVSTQCLPYLQVDASVDVFIGKYQRALNELNVILYRIQLPDTYISPLFYKIYCWKVKPSLISEPHTSRSRDAWM